MDQIRNFRDFLKLYNQISDSCFRKCTNSFFSRELEPDESKCVDVCAQKFIHVNHKLMGIYMELQAVIVQKRMDEMNAQMAAQEALQAQNEEQSNVVK